jgi:choline-glycine betaine transporter
MTLLAASGLAGLLPFLLVIACPLVMIFMMKGMHRGHGQGHGHTQPKSRERMRMYHLSDARHKLTQEIGQRAEEIVYSGDSHRRVSP